MLLSESGHRAPLSARLIEDGVVYPTIRVASHPGKLLMGVYDGHDAYVDGTVLDRRSGERGAPVPRELFPTIAEPAEPEAIYCGPLYFHFGHFLLESLARTWYAQQRPEVPLVWAGAHNWQGYELSPWQRQVLDILALPNPTRIVADPTRFERLHVPDLGFRYDDQFHPQHAAFLARYEGPAQVGGHRLWLSRREAGSRVGDLNSAPSERRLAYAGWTVVRPEGLTIRQQLDHLARAEVVAGEEGSAFHTLVLLKEVSGKRFRVFRRYGREHGSLHTIGRARGVNQSFHTLRRERVLSAEGRLVSKINPNSSEILDVLDVPVPPTPAAPTVEEQVLSRLLDRLEPQGVLDVDAATPGLVARSTAPTRVAVCRRFDVDPRTYASSGVDFYELGLDRYAETFHGDRGPFAVIRLAGPDFATTMASFCASQRLADEHTTWILGLGRAGARAALAIRLLHPGFAAGRHLVGLNVVYVVRRVPAEPTEERGVGELSEAELRRRTRWLPLVRVRRDPPEHRAEG